MKPKRTLGQRCAAILRRRKIKMPAGLTYARYAEVVDRADRRNP